MKREGVLFILMLTIGFLGYSLSCSGQQPSVPVTVSQNLTTMFPQAKSVEWRSYPDVIQAVFSIDGMKCEAKFKPGGGWVMTERQMQTDSLPKAVKEGLQSGPYADWSIEKSFVLSFPDSSQQYRIVVINKEMVKKIAPFDAQGRLLKGL